MAGALVTGAGRGLGLEIARALAARGLTVNVTDVELAGAEHAAREIGGASWASALDVRDAEACGAAARRIVERTGSLSVWVNNAGVLRTGASWEHDVAERELILDVNALGTINGTCAALEPMREAGSGHVINVVSLAGLGSPPGEALYAASKHAALAFSVGTHFDLRRMGIDDVRVSAVCPDGIWTPMLYDRLADPDAALSFSGRLLRPEDVAEATVALLDHPRPVVALPRARGWQVRFLASFPRLSSRLMPVILRDARRRQKRWERRIERGELP